MQTLEEYFAPYRQNIIGINHEINGKPIVYADWTASGRCYGPIERILQEDVMPWVANTHTETSSTGMAMTYAYHRARNLIKKHVGAGPDDVLISSASGMTGVINKLQRMLGLKIHERFSRQIKIDDKTRPVIFITHMEHHSNHTTWLETVAHVEVIRPTPEGLVDLEHLAALLEEYKTSQMKIASVTAASNVTGITTPYYEIAKMMHQHGGFCFVDFACAAPYVEINMHPDMGIESSQDSSQDSSLDASLDAIFFSPHKFLGGPGTTGILLFHKKLYDNHIPDHPGGGTVEWTNPWGEHKYVHDIEEREDGGTPAFLQTIKVALCLQLKEQMGIQNILAREEELLRIFWEILGPIPNVHILAETQKHRLGVISFYIDGLHHNLGVRMLSDRFGVQVRGGCSCAGTYGHYLLNVDPQKSHSITDKINQGDYSLKPGWIRASIHPTMTDAEARYVAESIRTVAENFADWAQDYTFNPCKNILRAKDETQVAQLQDKIDTWFVRAL